MKLLAVDTSTEACSVALWLDDVACEHFEVPGRGHTERLLPMVCALMVEAGLGFAQLDGLVCGVGPGSFAGVRIATGFVKGLALGMDRPVVGVSSLEMLAARALDAGAQRVLAGIDARMGEVYFGAFDADASGLPRALSAETVGAPAEIAEPGPGPWAAVGTAWGSYEVTLRTATRVELASVDGAALPHAADALRIAVPQFALGLAISGDALMPSYVRNRVALTLVEQAALRAANRKAAGP